MAREVSPSSHKCEGNDSVIPGLKRSFPSTSFVSKSLLRQLGSGVYSKEGELYQIKTSEQLDAEHLSIPCFQKMGDCSSSYSWPPELNSRFSIPLHPVSTEWSLDPSSFLFLHCSIPQLQVDLFATCLNTQLLEFVSPMSDNLALAQDTMSLDWNQWSSIYPFLPVNFLLQILPKLKLFCSLAILIAPKWKNSPWFPLLSSLCRKFPLTNLILSQKVRGKSFCAQSFLVQSLSAWIFYRKPYLHAGIRK